MQSPAISFPESALPLQLESLSKDVFERRTSTGSKTFSLFTSLDDIKFVLLSFFTLIETI